MTHCLCLSIRWLCIEWTRYWSVRVFGPYEFPSLRLPARNVSAYRCVGVSAFAKHHQLRRDLLVITVPKSSLTPPDADTPIRRPAETLLLAASLESGDLEARRAGEMIAWGGAKRSPRYAKRRLALKVRRHACRRIGVCKASSSPSRPPGHYRAEKQSYFRANTPTRRHASPAARVDIKLE
jgi:hypothetical protein